MNWISFASLGLHSKLSVSGAVNGLHNPRLKLWVALLVWRGLNMAAGMKFWVLFGFVAAVTACNSPEDLARQNAEFKNRHFVGTNAAGKSTYERVLFGDRVPRRDNILLGYTDETVRQIPVSKLPKPEIAGFTERLFEDWCTQDGFQTFRVTRVEHNGDFRVQVSGGGRTYFPSYDVTVECV
ncbi:hypothetical protein [uncultured Tateyamaria sp.]|uniref:hypothetical protein n=1 Tax=uncultured Tateyamaria sp. TaxID=455651 RepID=UPI0026043D68|nr:hypothetical protein [uncultured Tateyamaria sp.]